VTHDGRIAPDHQAVSALEPRDSAAGPDVHVVDSVRPESFGPAQVLVEARVAAVDQDVAPFEERLERIDRLLDERDGHHHPDRARPG